jgi:hypothetical protein
MEEPHWIKAVRVLLRHVNRLIDEYPDIKLVMVDGKLDFKEPRQRKIMDPDPVILRRAHRRRRK